VELVWDRNHTTAVARQKKFTTALNRPAEIVRVLLAANAFVVASLADAPLDVLLVLLKEHPEALADIHRN